MYGFPSFGSVGFGAQALFEASYARFKIGNYIAVADDGGVVFHDGAAKADDLIGEVFALCVDFGIEVVDVGGDCSAEVRRCGRLSGFAQRGFSRKSCRTRLSGSSGICHPFEVSVIR